MEKKKIADAKTSLLLCLGPSPKVFKSQEPSDFLDSRSLSILAPRTSNLAIRLEDQLLSTKSTLLILIQDHTFPG